MIAAIPTKGDVSATEISQLLLDIINMTAHAGINLLSIGADGVIAEMKAQEKIINNESIEKYLEFEDSFYRINFHAPIYNNRPIIRVQCPKHAKKTARNQIHYGSKLLTFGNDTIHYDQLLELAQFPNSPICVRDVCNVDKQDDAATYQTFHSDLISICHKDGILSLGKTGFFVYMFILGELFDAYLNRQINHK
ncbi:hypothetical protein C1646_806418, partial [Rhizophagus diaphanus]